MWESRALTAVAAAVVGGAVGGLVVWVLLRTGVVDSQGPAVTAERAGMAVGKGGEGPGDGMAALRSRIEILEARVAASQRKASARAALAAYNAAAMRGESDAGSDDTDLAPVIDEEDPVFERAVRGVLDRIDEEREAERVVRRQDRARALTELMAEQLRLTATQRPKVERILAEQFSAFRELRRPSADAGIQRPVTRSQWHERMQDIRRQTEQELSRVLDEEQMSSYRQLIEREGIGAGWGRRGGGRDARPQRAAPADGDAPE